MLSRVLYDSNRIPYRIDRRLTGLVGPEYDAIISFEPPFESEDSQYGESRFSHSDPKKRAGFGKWSTEVRKSAKLRLSFSAPAGHNSRAKGSNSQAALSIVKNGPPWVNCVTLTQLGARASAESNPGGGSQPRFS